ncbi:hypothetical protein [Mycobacterium sp. DL592]|uniref:hypothetical protein n=1 Tax=Mycobacterium sp. DL592 TaxID=2675524 RepID=UPI0014223A0F|nr:hypothetical protein [Mycobacterium sp. DL592]
MPLRNTTDLLQLRWRTAQWMLAATTGDKEQTAALCEAMRIEGVDLGDVLDETTLLIRQFGQRPTAALRDEVTRLWLKLKARP